ncbi:MAG: mechanosensitive ion channel family protein, partial [Bacteroidota bacterium]
TYRRYSTTIGLTYDTTSEQMTRFVEGVQQIVEAHPTTRKESSTVQFHEMADSSLNIFFAAIFELTDHKAWLVARQEILLEIMKLAEEIGVSFAFPSTSLYIESLPNPMQKGAVG